MSVYKRKNAETYTYDFQIRGVRFEGNTGAATKREAEIEEKRLKAAARQAMPAKGEALTIGAAFARYFLEVGTYHVNADTTLNELTWLETELGKARSLSSISTADITRLVAKRRGTGVKAATVNRSVTVRLRAILNYARDKWEIPVQKIDFAGQMLKEPQERVRELTADEQERLFAVLRPDFHPIVRFALLSGCRMQELLDLTWRDIDLAARNFTVLGKGDKTRTNPVSSAMLDILKDLRISLGRVPGPAEPVFTYVVKRADKETGRARGQRLPIEREALKITYKRAITKAKITNFRFHDLRHTAATRLLRATGNLRIPQRLLGHSKIETTLKYAHVTDTDIREAMEKTTPLQPKSDTKKAGGETGQ